MVDEVEQTGEPEPAPSKAPSHRKRAIALLAAVAVVVASGLVGWAVFALKPKQRPEEPVDTALASVPPVVPVSAPPPAATVDLIGDYPTPDAIVPREVWSDVAIFELQYDTPGRPVGGTAIIRAVSVATGEILWTMDALPDGTPISKWIGLEQWNGKLALSLNSSGDQCDPDILILALTTGDVFTSRFFGCDIDNEDGTHSSSTVLKDYLSGIVVIDQFDSVTPRTPNVSSAVTTTAYADTDLSTPLWRSLRERGAPNTGFDALRSEDIVLGSWVLTQSGTYVSLTDGTPSSANPPIVGRGNQELLFDINGVLIELIPSQPSEDGSWFARMSAWSDIDLTENLWSFTPADGWGLDLYGTIGCSSNDTLLVKYTRTEDVLDRNTMIAAVSLGTGELLWSKPFIGSPIGGQELMCEFVGDGDEKRVVYFSDAELEVVDAATGTEIAERSGFMPDDAEYAEMYSCGDQMACVVTSVSGATWRTHKGTVTAVDVSSPELDAQWSKQFIKPGAYWMAFGTADGLVAAGWDLSGYYQILKA